MENPFKKIKMKFEFAKLRKKIHSVNHKSQKRLQLFFRVYLSLLDKCSEL